MAGRVQGDWIFDHVREILARLPFKSLMRFKSLSKQWKLEISGDKFIRFKNQLSTGEHKDFWRTDFGGDFPGLVLLRIDSTNFDSLEVNIHPIEKIKIPRGTLVATHRPHAVMNCGGVLCFFIKNYQLIETGDYIRGYQLIDMGDYIRESHYSFVVWNPLTTEHKIFSRPYEMGWTSFGFGYDYSADDYKVIYASGSDRRETKVECLSLKTGVGNTARIDLPYHFEIRGFSTDVNGYLYWLAINCEEDHDGIVILCLDLEKEVISEVTSLRKVLNARPLCYLNVLEGSLCLVSYYDVASPFDVWMMKEDQMTTTKYWIKFMTIPPTFLFTPHLLCIIKNDVLYKVQRLDSEEFFLYNLLDGSLNKIVARGYDWVRYSSSPFLPY